MAELIPGAARWVRRAAMALVCSTLACVFLLTGAQPARAAQTDEPVLTVSQHLAYPAGESGLRQTWEYRLERVSAGAPMPAGAQGDTLTWSMTGDTTVSWVLEAPAESADYWYRMEQVVPDGLKAGYTPDRTVYDVRLYVASNGHASVIVYQDGMKEADPAWTVLFKKPAPTPQKPAGIWGTIAGVLPKTGDMSYLVMGAAVVIAVVGTCAVALGRSMSGRQVESAAGKGAHYDEV